MKMLLIASLSVLSLNCFSQSYMILQNGVTLSTDKAGFIYDFGHFSMPYKVTVNGGQFYVEDEKLVTIDEKGFVYNKDLKVKKAKLKGLNYILSDDKFVTIDSQGFFYEFDKDASTKKIANAGGIFFTVNTDEKKKIVDLFTVNSKGNYFKVTLPGLNPADISVFGGTFFMTNKGVIHTVSKDGFVFAKPEIKVGTITKAGGNFFADSTGKIYTVSEDGFLMLPVLPTTVKAATSFSKLGANYFQDQTGKTFTVDKMGAINERSIKDHDLSNVKIISL